jgi:hypothetical protein
MCKQCVRIWETRNTYLFLRNLNQRVARPYDK